MKDTLPVRVRLGLFELDVRAGELRRGERIVRLQEQPFKILLMLVERDGDVVTREDIQRKLWPNDTVVEFDHGINTAIKKLRQALDDSADEPKYIETLARRGYRLVVAVERVAADDSDCAPLKAQAQTQTKDAGMGRPQPTTHPPDPRALSGRTVSHYRVLDIIGGGGMGVVYRAEDLKLGRRVALKFLPEELANDPVTLRRFEREARTASSFNHPNICTVYEVEEHDEQPFLVMEYLQGETLRDRLATVAAGGKGMPLDQLLDIAQQICGGLQAAHGKGIIHRDIKPANIFLTSTGQVKILDFGLAKLVDAAKQWGSDGPQAAGSKVSSPRQPTRDDVGLTRLGSAMGTAGYMSPEQVRGEKLDARTDIFSFGLVLYEMASGQRAFRGDSAEMVRDAIVNQTPISVHDLNSTLPPKLKAIIDKALEKYRESRHQSAEELRTELEKIQLDERPHRRFGRWKLIASMVAILALMIAGGLYRWHPSKPSVLRQNDTVVLAVFDNSTGNPLFDASLGAALYNDLEQSPFFNELNYSKVASTLQLMKRSPSERLTIDLARQVCLHTNSKAVIAGSIADAGNGYRIGLKAVECETGATVAHIEAEAQGQNAVIRTLGQVGTQLRLELGEPPASVQKFNRPLEEALTSSAEALKAFSLGVFATNGDEAVPHYKRAIELDPNFTMAYWWLALTYANLNQTDLSNQSYATAFPLRHHLNDRDKLSLEATYYLVVTGELERAIQVLEETIRTYPEHYYDHENLGLVYNDLGRYREAASEQTIGLQIDPYQPFLAASLAQSYVALDQLEQAQSVFQEARGRGLDDPSLHFVGYTLSFMQRDKKGMEKEITWGTGKPKVEDVLFSQQSDTEAYHGHLGSARRFADRAVSSAQQAGAKDTSAGWRLNQALREVEVGNVDRARRMASEALSMSRVREVKLGAALVFARTGDAAAAEKLADEINEEFPVNTLFQEYSLPLIRAVMAMQRNDPTRSIEILKQTRPYELTRVGLGLSGNSGFYAVYVRGQAYIKLGEAQRAAAEFKKMIDHPGITRNFVTGALAHLQLGRAQALMGDKVAARKSYQDFLALWKDADPDIPIYQQAKLEYAKPH